MRFALVAFLAGAAWPGFAGAASAEEAAAPIFRAPLFVGEPYRAEAGGHTLIAARGAVVLVAAEEGLRRYDLQQRTLSRPAGTPEGRATAVVAGTREIWAAVDGRLYRSADGGRTFQLGEPRVWKEITYLAVDSDDLWLVADGTLHRRGSDGRLAAIDLHRPGTFAEAVALASASKGVCWASFYWSGGADAGSRASPRHTALIRVRGAAVEMFHHPEEGEYLSPHALLAQPDGSVLVGFVEGRGTPVAGRYFHRFDGKTWTPIGGWAAPYQRQPDGSRRFVPNTGAPIRWRLAAGSGDGRFWIASEHHDLSVVPADPARPPLGYPAEAGELLGVAETPLGLIVLGDRRLARWQGGHWTLLTAPDGRGISREKTVPDRPGFYHPTGLVLGPGPGDSTVAASPRTPRAAKPIGAVGGAPLFEGQPPMWMDGLRDGLDTDLTVYLPDLDPRDRFRFVGLGARDMLTADASEAPQVLLSRPLPRDAGFLLSVEAAPVFRPSRTPAEDQLRFEPVRTVALVQSGQSILEAAARFQRENISALNHAVLQTGGPPLPPAIEHPTFLYDAQRERLMVCTAVEERRVLTEVCYMFQPERPARVEAVLVFVMENPR
jgi:hypothetical protein